MMTDQPTGFAEGGYDSADDTPTAGERAQSVIAQVCVEHPGRWDLSILVLDALLAHPDLLVDLAIEAGGLEQVGWCHERTWAEGDEPLRGFSVAKLNEEVIGPSEPVYRRTPKEANDGDG